MKPIQLAAVIAIAFAPLASAQDGAREKIQKLEAEASAAQAAGRAEEAEKYRKAVREIAELKKAEAERGGDRQRIEEVRAKLDQSRRELAEAAKTGRESLAAEIKERVSHLENSLREGDRREGAGREKQPELADVKRRLQHLNEAIDHLRAAGINEAAASLSEQARAMKQRLVEQGARGEAPEIGRQIAEMREGIVTLQRQMQEMQKRLEELSRDRK